MELPYTDAERRSFVRMNLENRVSFTVGNSKDVFEGTSVNLSGRGILFQTDCPLKPDDELDITILSCDSNEPPLTATIQVIRVNEQNQEGKINYDVAGEFIGVK